MGVKQKVFTVKVKYNNDVLKVLKVTQCKEMSNFILFFYHSYIS